MVCAVAGCDEGPELKTDPCSVCGKPVHHMCAIEVYEGEASALNERFCIVRPNGLPQRNYSNLSASPKRPVIPSVSGSRNIWIGSDSDFIPSPGVVSERIVASEKRPSKRRKLAAKCTTGKSCGDADTTGIPPAPDSPVSDLGIPLSVTHSRKDSTTDPVWDLVHVVDIPYRKRTPKEKDNAVQLGGGLTQHKAYEQRKGPYRLET
ncbi:LOW QUALITY PROTEIN: hypothetical protein PHMEG_0001468 [Phytophthora megakarya]|uniref:Uncharacterized protein n=1 Tax=Phytophthora megakarya TaxID=4795 RepID=A0A225X134_9STRA|nr:LOW QUALITY PROTEIN: hypothetical protein PHMEG_0001468 [Phytophthora megakarya]